MIKKKGSLLRQINKQKKQKKGGHNTHKKKTNKSNLKL